MRFSTLLTALSASALSSARIIGIAAPSTLAPSQPYNLTLITENYIQAVADIAVAWGLAPSPGYPFTLGSYSSSAYLGPDKSNTLTNVTIPATAPEALQNWMGKEMLLSAGVYSLYGVSGSVSMANFNVTVMVGEETGAELVRSTGFVWGTGQC
ncbi:hypothetical protein BU26DRAFT_353122 [Trematosphaeria pertusa]|uniref:Uncharacterized protein n=1 Tax=Trematosphaeria pertusa TaxID=390896 RepID=A0A6A6IBJ1_9PLEO|nr:uncharacterized protein BU26DRAFT_353122 [Trematosphaeria pertusa]KAF2247751.1 hypothetical protein BU26DRAFT_353122 [Trematosphaeria pertusa]